MSRVFITDYIDNPDVEKKILGSNLSATKSKEIEVLLVWHEKINAEYLDQFPNLKGVVRYGVGIDGIDLEAIKERGLVFCNTPDYGTDEVSDTALAMMLTLLRGVFAYNHFSKGYYDTWQENTISSLRRTSELTLGVIGAGRIGTALMRKSKELNMKIIFFDPYLDAGYEKAISVKRANSLNELLEQSDVVSIHTPLNNETKGMVSSSFISKMKKGSILINTARGEIIENLDIIYYALKNKILSSVALDVLPEEPPSASDLINLWRQDDPEIAHKIIINPHSAYYSMDSYEEMRSKAAENSNRILNNIKPLNLITK
jgi:C-terminal binding protein